MRLSTLVALGLPFLLAGCGQMPGEPHSPPVPPEQVTDFATLYARNCQACHGTGGQNGPAMDLANPEFQALVDDNTLRTIISDGLPGTQMPAWAQSAGGMLTDQQISAIIGGMRRNWAKPDAFGGATPPAFEQPKGGDANHGRQVYQARCAGCHSGPKRQQLTSPVYLSLVSDQALRSIILAGRPDIGQPDWRMQTPQTSGPPLAPQDVTDVVAYLGSLRNPDVVSAAPTPMPSPRR